MNSPSEYGTNRVLAALEAHRNDGTYAFCCVPSGEVPPACRPVATVREAEGLTLVVNEDEALAAGLEVLFRAAWISLGVQTELEAVGITARISVALAESSVPCNVFAGMFHDHLFVPVERADLALQVLREVQEAALQELEGQA